jgi:tetratricopeptide (TPR) repeat protein
MSDTLGPNTASRSSRSGILRSVGLLVGFLAIVNVGAFFAAPSLFELDRARGPYSAANNLELTRVYARAIEEYTKIIERFPDSRYAALSEIGIANSMFGMGRRAEAIESYNKLLETLRGQPDYSAYRLTILGKLASAYQDAGDDEGFRAVYALLLEEHPEQDVTIRARRFFEELEAAEAAAAQASENGMVTGVTVSLPAAQGVGETVAATVTIAPGAVEPGPFGLAVNLAFWDGFRLLGTSPSSTSTSDFWGKRFLQYDMPLEGPFEVTLRLQADKPGTFVFDLDLEQSFEIRELGIAISTEVSGQ